jgi:Ser/Thr protein kinase RdoA (MazF antagonist)
LLKACLFRSEQRCQRVHDLLTEIEAGVVPRVVTRYGPWLVVEWIEGRVVAPVRPRRETLRAIGRLHGRLHSTLQPMRRERHQTPIDGHKSEQLDVWLTDLVRLGAVSSAQRVSLLHLARLNCPESWSVGLVHGDLCGENLVIGRAGHPVMIDFETLDLDGLDFDLARTWYRWPLSRRQRLTYLEGYRQYRSVDRLEENFLFWAIRATVQSAAFRVGNETPGQDVPIAVLNEIIRRAGRPKDLFLAGAHS